MNIAVGDVAALPLEDNSVDLVFTSPPYEDARTYGIDYKLKGEAWVEWAVPRFEECLRVSRGLVAWVVAGRTRQFRWSATPAMLMADLHRRGVKLRNPPIYHRVGIPGSGGPDWLRNDYEWIVCAAKGRLPWADNTACGHPPKFPPGGAMSNRHPDGRRTNDHASARCKARMGDGRVRSARALERRPNGSRQIRTYEAPAKANPGNVIACHGGGGHMGHALAHETEAPFPLKLAEFFVLSFCAPGGVVLDPMMGSGTTLHAAMKHGRQAIGYDIRENQVELTRRRLEDVVTSN